MSTKAKYNGKFNQANTPKQAQVKPAKVKVPFRRKVKRVARAIKHNRFYQIILYVLLCVLISFGTRIHQMNRDKIEYTELMEVQKTEIIAEYEAQMEAMRKSHREELNAVHASYQEESPEDLIKRDSEYLAKMLYGYRFNEPRDLRTATWCALNRVDNPAYPDSVKGVCEQPSQWMGYSSSNPVLTDLYEIAEKEVRTWYNNYRPVSEDYVYMHWSSKEIILRDTWENGKNTHYWQAG